MAEEMHIEVAIIVGQRIRGRIKRKHIRYFTLPNMTFDEYHKASDIIVADMSALGQQLLDAGYAMEYKGEQVTKD